MKIVEDPIINEIVREIAISGFIQLEFVIAGGFPTALYDLHLKSDYVKREVLFNLKMLNYNNKAFKDFYSKFSDIDYWALEGSRSEVFIKDFIYNKKFDNIYEHQVKSLFTSVCDNIQLQSVSSYAFNLAGFNSQSASQIKSRHQVLRRKIFSSIDEIFDNFDLDVCQTAWHNGKLYISDINENNFAINYFTFNEDFLEYSLLFHRVVTARRVVKYHNRYGLQPAEELVKKVLSVIQQSLEFLKENPGELDIFEDLISANAEYDIGAHISTSTVKSMSEELVARVPYIFSFQNFKPSYASYLLDAEHETLRFNIQRYFRVVSDLKELA